MQHRLARLATLVGARRAASTGLAGVAGGPGRPGGAPPRLLRQRDPRPGARRHRERHLPEEAGQERRPSSLSSSTPARLAIEAMLGDSLDASYIGPNPAINGFAQSNGELLRIVSGATSGGAFLVVKPEIKNAKDLEGKTISTPQLGNTQDVALRAWLEEQGLRDRRVRRRRRAASCPQDNAQTLTQFQAGDIDGAWVPEPWATRLVEEGGGKILVDEADLWPDGQYVTTQLIVRTEFLDEHPDVVKKLVEGQVAANDFIANEPEERPRRSWRRASRPPPTKPIDPAARRPPRSTTSRSPTTRSRRRSRSRPRTPRRWASSTRST